MMLVTAHQGASGDYPDNTLLAFEKAIEHGAEAIELDVHRCKSGEMVVIHDESVDRTTNGTGKVADLTLAELKQLDAGEGEKIPTLDETLAMLAGRVTVFVELKDTAIQEVADSVHRAVREHGFTYDQLPVIGFDHQDLLALKITNPDIQTGLTWSERRQDIASIIMIPEAKMMGAVAINPEHTMITPELVERAHKVGLKVNTWTVNEPDDIRRMIDAGVDAIMSDYPKRVVRQLQVANGKEQGAPAR